MNRIVAPAILVLGLALAGAWTATESPTHAGTALRMDVEALAAHADLVVEARVLDRRARRDPRGWIVSDHDLVVGHTYWGEPRALRTVTLLGGVLPDGRGLVLPGAPRLEPGEEVLLFLSPEGAAGARHVVGLAQGKLRIARDARGRKVLVREAPGLELVEATGSAPRQADERLVLDYAATRARLVAALAARSAREAGEGGR